MTATPTPIDVHLMPAGRQLDESIAIAVFGWQREPNHPDWPTQGTILVPGHSDPRRGWCAEWDEYGRPNWLPNYSGDVALAFEALGALTKDVNGTDRCYWKLTSMPSCFSIQIWRADGDSWKQPQYGRSIEAHGLTAPLAICRAIVKALRS